MILNTNIRLEQVRVYLWLIIALLIPFSFFQITYLIGILVLCTLFQKSFYKKTWYVFTTREFIPIVLYFIILVFSLLYSSNFSEGIKDIEIKISLIIIPIVVYQSRDLIYKIYIRILKFFVFGTTITSFINYVIAFVKSIHYRIDLGFYMKFFPNFNWWENNFLYNRLSFFTHPSYFSLFVVFSIFIIIYFHKNKIINLRRNPSYLLMISFLIITTILLLSKANLLTLFILLFIHLIRSKSNKIKIAVGAVLVVLPILFFSIKSMRVNNVTKLMENNVSISSSQNKRLLIWESCIMLIKDQPLFGYGVGDVKDRLHQKIVHDNHSNQQINSQYFNPHNQFLQSFLAVGILGFAGLVFVFIYPLILYPKNEILIDLIILMAINLMVESMFQRLDGVLFFIFFYSLIMIKQKKIT